MNLEFLINNLITSGIEFTDPDTLRRIKTLNIFQLVFIMLAPVLGLFYFYIGAILLFNACIFAGVFMVLGVVLLRKTRNLLLVGNYAIFILWSVLFIIAWNTGAITYDGVIQPAWMLNAGLILLAIILNGYLSGTVWATIVFLQAGLVIYLYRAGHQFTNLIPIEITAAYSMGTYMVCLLAILLFAFLFEKEKSEALGREREKSYALRESKKYIDEIFERSPLATFIIDRSHRVIQWNRACYELTGVAAADIIGKDVWEGFTINDHGSIADIVIRDRNVIAEEFSDSIISQSDSGWFELNIFFPNLQGGKQAIVTAAPILDNDGVVRGAIQTIQEVRKHENGHGIMINCLDESFPKPVFKINAQGKINFWNNACEEIFGYSSSDMIGNSPLSLVAKRYRPVFKNTFSKVLKGEFFANMAWRYRTSEGKPSYILARAFPFQKEEEEAVECIIINTDITDLRLKLKKLSHYAAGSKEKLKNLSEEYDLLKKNIATFLRKKDDQEGN